MSTPDAWRHHRELVFGATVFRDVGREDLMALKPPLRIGRNDVPAPSPTTTRSPPATPSP